MSWFILQVGPVDGQKVSVRLQAVRDLLGNTVAQPRFLQLLIAVWAQVQGIASPVAKNGSVQCEWYRKSVTERVTERVVHEESGTERV